MVIGMFNRFCEMMRLEGVNQIKENENSNLPNLVGPQLTEADQDCNSISVSSKGNNINH